MRASARAAALAILLTVSTAPVALAQQPARTYAGGLVGVSTLSADARAQTEPPNAQLSLYKPENGLALNLFAGIHLSRFLSAQANYVWNRNDVMLLSSALSPSAGVFSAQSRGTTQRAVVGDLLLYFRALGDGVRPYLSTGVGVVRFTSRRARRTVQSGTAAPVGAITATHVGLRVAVGIDLAVRSQWAVRYSFSETISGNPISPHLMPPGTRNLANFQNLFGVVFTL